jgi:hypothetical protein
MKGTMLYNSGASHSCEAGCFWINKHTLWKIRKRHCSQESLPQGLPVNVGTPSRHLTSLDAVLLFNVYPEVLLQVTEYAAPCATVACATVPMKGPPIAMLTSVMLVEPVHEATRETKAQKQSLNRNPYL